MVLFSKLVSFLVQTRMSVLRAGAAQEGGTWKAAWLALKEPAVYVRVSSLW